MARPRIEPASVVSCDPEVHSGSLVFAGTRVPVGISADYLNGGQSIDEFLAGFLSVQCVEVEAFLNLSPEAVDQMRTHGPRAG